MRNLLFVCLSGFVFAAGALPGAVGQSAGSELETASKAMSTTPPTASVSNEPVKSAGSRFGWLWFPGAIAAYFALQMWILPKMGVST